MVLLDSQGKKMVKSKRKQWEGSGGGSVFPIDHVYIERLFHLLEGKGIGGKNISASINPSSWSALWEQTTNLISELGWRSEAGAEKQTLLFLFWCRQLACTLPLPSLCVDYLFLCNWLVWGKHTRLWWKVLRSPNESIVPSHFPVHLYNTGTFWPQSALFLHLFFRWL